MANPKQYIVTPNPDITSRDNVESVSSEGGAHVGPAYPSSDNEGAMVPFQKHTAHLQKRILITGSSSRAALAAQSGFGKKRETVTPCGEVLVTFATKQITTTRSKNLKERLK